MFPWLLAAAAALAGDRLDYVTIDSAAERRPMTYGVYTPPGWDGVTPLPLVVFLHGGGDDERALDEHPVVWRTFDREIASGNLPPFVMIVPNGERSFWRNWADGSHHFEDWVLDEAIRDARARYALRPGPEDQHLLGISMGGAGTLYLGLAHLDDFASLGVISAPVFDAEQTLRFLSGDFLPAAWPVEAVFGAPDPARIQVDNAYARLSAPDALGDTQLYLAAGTSDLFGIGKSNEVFHEHLAAHGVPHTWQRFPGGHRWVDWAKVFPVALCEALGGASCLDDAGGRVVQTR